MLTLSRRSYTLSISQSEKEIYQPQGGKASSLQNAAAALAGEGERQALAYEGLDGVVHTWSGPRS